MIPTRWPAPTVPPLPAALGDDWPLRPMLRLSSTYQIVTLHERPYVAILHDYRSLEGHNRVFEMITRRKPGQAEQEGKASISRAQLVIRDVIDRVTPDETGQRSVERYCAWGALPGRWFVLG